MGKRWNGKKMSHCKPDKVKSRPPRKGGNYQVPPKRKK